MCLLLLAVQCDSKFNHPTIDLGGSTNRRISMLDIVDEFDKFWNIRKVLTSLRELVSTFAGRQNADLC